MRHRHLAVPTIEAVAEILAMAPVDQPWRLEAPVRHAIRRLLLSSGWSSWYAADFKASS
jgi:hypothetical protein